MDFDHAFSTATGDDDQRRVEKPWGYEIWWAHTESYAAKFLIVRAGHKLSVQLHDQKDETSYLLAGRMNLWQGPSVEKMEAREIGPGASWRNEPGIVHSIEAIDDSTVIEVSTPELDDVTRLSDRYGR